MADDGCQHIDALEHIKEPGRHECEECVPAGGEWVELRTCQACGTTRCCDSSPNQHASRHAKEAGHPVMASAQPGERWLWCFEHEAMAEY